MKTTALAARRFEFWYPQLDTLVLVQQFGDEVVIHATRSTFTEEQKTVFIRWLAHEGFISDRLRWFPGSGASAESHVRWLVDYSWLELSEAALACSRRFMGRLFLSAAVLWVLLMWSLYLRVTT